MKLLKNLIIIALIANTFCLNLKNAKEAEEKNLSKQVKINNKPDDKSKAPEKPEKKDVINNTVGRTTTFDKGTEAETVDDKNAATKINALPEKKPEPLEKRKDIPNLTGHINPADKAQLKNTGLDVNDDPPKRVVLDKVSYVKELSPAGKASLELAESGDIEYQKLLNAGFESPKTISTIIDDKTTKVSKAATTDHLWQPIEPRNNNFWQNVEYNRYNNRLMDTTRYFTPAKFEKNMFGNVIVHAPSDSDMSIATNAHKTISHTAIGFLSVDEKENMISEDELSSLDTSDNGEHPNYYNDLN